MLEKPLEPPRLPGVSYSPFKLQVLCSRTEVPLCSYMYNVKYVEFKQSDICQKYFTVPTCNLHHKQMNSVHFDRRTLNL